MNRNGFLAAIFVVVAGIAAAVWFGERTTRTANAGETLRVGIYTFPPTKGSPIRAAGTPAIYLVTAVFDTLVEVGPGGELRPSLATSWEQTASNRWLFHLRPSVRFSNGEPLDARAVTTSIGRLRATPTALSGLVANVEDVRAIDELTVEVITAAPAVTLPADLSGVWIVPPKAWAAAGSEAAFGVAPIGTGSFVVTSWAENTIVMKANPTAWRKPLLDGITFTLISDEAARVAALQSGAIDVAIQISADTSDAVVAAGGRALSMQIGTVHGLGLIAVRPESPFVDRRVRQAMNYAIDKEGIARELFRGTTVASGQPAARVVAGHDPTIAPYPQDTAKARALLAEAGYADGFDLKVEVVTNALPSDSAIFSSVARDLAAVGIRTEMRAVPLALYVTHYADISFEGDAFQLGFTATPHFDTVKAVNDFTCNKSGGRAFICLPEIEPLMAAARAAPDLAARRKIETEINRVAHEEALGVFLFEGVDLIAVGPGVETPPLETRYIHWEAFRK